MTDDASRKAFEEWLKSDVLTFDPYLLRQTNDGRGYRDGVVNQAWRAWTYARTAALAESANVIEEARCEIDKLKGALNIAVSRGCSHCDDSIRQAREACRE